MIIDFKEKLTLKALRKMNKISYDHADLTFHIVIALMKQMALMLAIFVATTIAMSSPTALFDSLSLGIFIGAALVPFATGAIFYAYFRVTETRKLKTETNFKEKQNA